VVGRWIGFGDYCGTFYRLALESGGTGELCELGREPGTVWAYPIRQWTLGPDGLSCRFDLPVGGGGPRRLDCGVRGDFLDSRLLWNGGRFDDVVFRREEFVYTNIARLKRLSPGK
jgi:hypothetical protein